MHFLLVDRSLPPLLRLPRALDGPLPLAMLLLPFPLSIWRLLAMLDCGLGSSYISSSIEPRTGKCVVGSLLMGIARAGTPCERRHLRLMKFLFCFFFDTAVSCASSSKALFFPFLVFLNMTLEAYHPLAGRKKTQTLPEAEAALTKTHSAYGRAQTPDSQLSPEQNIAPATPSA